mmetsp:Transcript_92535/g.160783  ORF Transcript_92535/g.160783 Transcript_92535/m.160783 type:complete len:224 (-) Transcript_92535:677-1348(-)
MGLRHGVDDLLGRASLQHGALHLGPALLCGRHWWRWNLRVVVDGRRETCPTRCRSTLQGGCFLWSSRFAGTELEEEVDLASQQRQYLTSPHRLQHLPYCRALRTRWYAAWCDLQPAHSRLGPHSDALYDPHFNDWYGDADSAPTVQGGGGQHEHRSFKSGFCTITSGTSSRGSLHAGSPREGVAGLQRGRKEDQRSFASAGLVAGRGYVAGHRGVWCSSNPRK